MTDPIQVLRDTLNESCISAECHAVGAAEHDEPHAMREAADAALQQVEALVQAARELVEDYEESDPFPTSDGHPLYAARAALAPFKENP